MKIDRKFIAIESVLELHKQIIQKSPLSGESDSVLNMGLLESAISQPQQTFSGDFLNPTIYDQAAAYLFSLAKNHAFENGNKRTALAVTVVFLKINGYEISLSKNITEQLILDVIVGDKTKDEIADIFRNGGIQPIVR